MSDTYEMASIAYVEGNIERAREQLNQALLCGGDTGLDSDEWASLWLCLGKAIFALDRAKDRVQLVRNRRLDINEEMKFQRDIDEAEMSPDDRKGA